MSSPPQGILNDVQDETSPICGASPSDGTYTIWFHESIVTVRILAGILQRGCFPAGQENIYSICLVQVGYPMAMVIMMKP